MFPLNQKFANPYEKQYQCETCKKTFTQQSNLCKHVLIHYGLKPFHCDLCGKRFTQQANLIKHKRVHTGDKPFVCKVCGRGFSQKANLKKHAQLHTGEKHYRCEYCDKAFAQQVNLDRHRRTHTGEKPYTCNICDKKFTQRGNLTKHELVHYVKNTSHAWSTQPAFPRMHLSKDSPLSSGSFETSHTSNPFKFDFDSYQLRKVNVPILMSAKDGILFKRL